MHGFPYMFIIFSSSLIRLLQGSPIIQWTSFPLFHRLLYMQTLLAYVVASPIIIAYIITFGLCNTLFHLNTTNK